MLGTGIFTLYMNESLIFVINVGRKIYQSQGSHGYSKLLTTKDLYYKFDGG